MQWHSDVVETAGDKAMDKALIETGKALLSLSGSSKNSAEISPAVIARLAERKEPFSVENTGLRLDFDPRSLAVQQVTGAGSGVSVQIGAREISGTEQQSILAGTPPGQTSGLFAVGGKIFDLTASVKAAEAEEKIAEFGAAVTVTIDLSHLGELSAEQISQLTGVRLEKDEEGKIAPVALGGTYDPATRTFTFSTDKFSLYTVMRQRLAIVLTIGSPEARVNGQPLGLDVPPALLDGRTLVPVRFIAESMGAKVEWSGETSTVRITVGQKVLNLAIGQRDAAAGLDVPARMVKGRTLVPLRYVSGALGAGVNWLPETNTVEIVQ